ncbi:MAG: hypothetical protein U0L76_01075 [Ruminococcus sp.]|nr:hypothetical protein [Ruminococcus sp.]
MKLELDKPIKSLLGIDICVEKEIGEGGQGTIYLVDYKGEKKALKIYNPNLLTDSDSFYNHLKHLVINGAPSKEFLWPIDIIRNFL